MKTPLGKPMDTFNKIGGWFSFDTEICWFCVPDLSKNVVQGELLRLAKEVVVSPASATKPPSHSRGNVTSSRDKPLKEDDDSLDIGEPRFFLKISLELF